MLLNQQCYEQGRLATPVTCHHLRHAGDCFQEPMCWRWLAPWEVLGSRANKTENRIIDCSKRCPFHWWIWLFPSFHVGLQMQTNCFQEHSEALCVTRCVVEHSIFHRCFLRIRVHCSDGEGLDSLRLFTCQLSPAVNGNIYIFYFRI